MKKLLTFLIILLIIPLASAAGGGGGGGYGGGSSGGGGSSTLEFTQSKTSMDKILKTGDYYTLKLKTKDSYDFFIKSQSSSEIKVIIAEPLQEITILIGSSEEIDLNKDGTTDILFEAKTIVTEKSTQITIKDTFERKPKQGKEQLKEKAQESIQNTEQQLLCGDKPTRRERVQCRLNLEKEEFEYEYSLRFLPEECTSLAENKKQICIQVYQDVQKCWEFPNTPARVSCVKAKLKFRGVSEEIQSCTQLKGEEKKNCIESVKENVFTIIKFKMYNLEEKAEEFLAEGKVSQDAAASFITEVEGKKIEFNQATKISDKRQIISAVNKLWKEFLKSI